MPRTNEENRPADTVPGVNVAAFFTHASGLGQAARSTVRALEAAGIAHVLNNAETRHPVSGIPYPLKIDDRHPVNLIHMSPTAVAGFMQSGGSANREDRYNVGMWLWESPQFPPAWIGAFDYFDEIWTPSSFCLDAISRVSPIPVVKIPLSIEPPAAKFDRAHFDLPADAFVFLFVFSFDSSFQRKNPVATIEAFRKAFGGTDRRVMLIIKSTHAWFDHSHYKEMEKACDGAVNIRLVDTVMERDEIDALISTCDCYVSLHRSEGFGLTMAEAMAYGKPVVATHYSANTDFMTISNSFPVGYKLRSMADAEHHLYREAGEWAEPDIDEAAQAMQRVFNEPEHAGEIGKRAQHDIQQRLSHNAVGKLIRQRLARIGQFIQEGTGQGSPPI